MCVIAFLLVVHLTPILVHPRVYRAHRLKSADLDNQPIWKLLTSVRKQQLKLQ